MSNSKAVSLWVLLTRQGRPAIPLVRRGPFNEKDQPQSYAGLLQPPVHGKTEGRPPLEALLAEAEEEGGPAFAALISQFVNQLEPLTSANDVQPYLIRLTEAQWATYEKGKEFSDLIVVTLEDFPEFRASTPKDKTGAKNRHVMFDDQLAILSDLMAP